MASILSDSNKDKIFGDGGNGVGALYLRSSAIDTADFSLSGVEHGLYACVVGKRADWPATALSIFGRSIRHRA